jgi:hypothetical protein
MRLERSERIMYKQEVQKWIQYTLLEHHDVLTGPLILLNIIQEGNFVVLVEWYLVECFSDFWMGADYNKTLTKKRSCNYRVK